MLVKDLLLEKFKNFIVFLKGLLNDKSELLEKYESIPVELIIEYIKTHIYPLKHDFDLLYLKLCNEYNIDTNKIPEESKNKLKKYMNFFVEIIEEIYHN